MRPLTRLSYFGWLDERSSVLLLVLVAFTAVWAGPASSAMIALAPLPMALGVTMVRKWPAVAAGALPLISVGLDGLLVHFDLQTPLKLSSAVVGVLLWTVLASRKSFHERTAGIAGWLALILIANYQLVALPTGRAIDRLVLALLVEALVICVAVSSISPHPNLVLLALTGAGLVAAWFSFFPDYYNGGRPFALGLDPNYLGFVGAVGCTATLTLARVARRLVFLVPAIPILAGLVQVQSRAAVLALGIGLIGVISLTEDRWRAVMFLFAAGMVVLGTLVMGAEPGFGVFTERRVDTDLSSEVREQIAQVNVDAVRSSPVVGVGLGAVAERAERSQELRREAVSHNEYLRLAAEVGIPAMVGMVVLLGVPILVGVASADRRSAAAVLWPSGAAVMLSMGFLNVLDNSQVACIVMTIAGAGWSSISPSQRMPHDTSGIARSWGRTA